MSRKPPPEVREMYTVFEEFFGTKSKAFASRKPTPIQCREMLQDAISMLRAYDESIGDLIAQRASIARHNALPKDYPIRINIPPDQLIV